MIDVTLSTTASTADGREVWGVYDPVFDDHPDHASWDEAVWSRHTARSGFVLARAHDGPSLVGFAYGYVGERGQWFTDHAAAALGASVATAWLGGHLEVVSLAVLDAARGHGVGRALLRSLTDGPPAGRTLDRAVLMTSADPADPARRLYAAEGWDVLGPGIGEGTVILGKQLAAHPDRRGARPRPS